MRTHTETHLRVRTHTHSHFCTHMGIQVVWVACSCNYIVKWRGMGCSCWQWYLMHLMLPGNLKCIHYTVKVNPLNLMGLQYLIMLFFSLSPSCSNLPLHFTLFPPLPSLPMEIPPRAIRQLSILGLCGAGSSCRRHPVVEERER